MKYNKKEGGGVDTAILSPHSSQFKKSKNNNTMSYHDQDYNMSIPYNLSVGQTSIPLSQLHDNYSSRKDHFSMIPLHEQEGGFVRALFQSFQDALQNVPDAEKNVIKDTAIHYAKSLLTNTTNSSNTTISQVGTAILDLVDPITAIYQAVVSPDVLTVANAASKVVQYVGLSDTFNFNRNSTIVDTTILVAEVLGDATTANELYQAWQDPNPIVLGTKILLHLDKRGKDVEQKGNKKVKKNKNSLNKINSDMKPEPVAPSFLSGSGDIPPPPPPPRTTPTLYLQGIDQMTTVIRGNNAVKNAIFTQICGDDVPQYGGSCGDEQSGGVRRGFIENGYRHVVPVMRAGLDFVGNQYTRIPGPVRTGLDFAANQLKALGISKSADIMLNTMPTEDTTNTNSTLWNQYGKTIEYVAPVVDFGITWAKSSGVLPKIDPILIKAIAGYKLGKEQYKVYNTENEKTENLREKDLAFIARIQKLIDSGVIEKTCGQKAIGSIENKIAQEDYRSNREDSRISNIINNISLQHTQDAVTAQNKTPLDVFDPSIYSDNLSSNEKEEPEANTTVVNRLISSMNESKAIKVQENIRQEIVNPTIVSVPVSNLGEQTDLYNTTTTSGGGKGGNAPKIVKRLVSQLKRKRMDVGKANAVSRSVIDRSAKKKR